jgi:eukaryotic-like serine/threonine-protein kinase
MRNSAYGTNRITGHRRQVQAEPGQLPHQVPLQAGDPRRVGRYRLTGRLDGLPSDDPIFTGMGPDGTEICITILRGNWDAAALDRFAAEAAVAKRVPPFCAARVLDAGLDGNDAYLVSEYVSGRSLLEVVAEYGVAAGPQLEALAIGMATGLASVHQAGLVHGSFGPQYVILAEHGPPHVVEFGITPPYGSATPSADMLAWGQSVVFAATGRPPGVAVDLDILPEILRDPVQQCLELDPPERPAARAVVQFLLGDRALPAGVLAEGSRRAARGSGWASLQAAGTAPARATGASQHSGRHPATSVSRPRPDAGGRSAGPASTPYRTSHVAASARHTGGGAAAGSHGPAQRRPGGPRRSGRSRALPWLIAGAGIVVVVLIVLLVLHLTQGGNSAATASANTGHRGASSTGSSGVPTASQGSVIPPAFNGTWSGLVTQPPSDTYNVTVTLSSGQTSGLISYAGAGTTCSGVLTPTSVSPTKMIMKLGTAQKGCANSTVTISLGRPNTLTFDEGNPAASGTLSRA